MKDSGSWFELETSQKLKKYDNQPPATFDARPVWNEPNLTQFASPISINHFTPERTALNFTRHLFIQYHIRICDSYRQQPQNIIEPSGKQLKNISYIYIWRLSQGEKETCQESICTKWGRSRARLVATIKQLPRILMEYRPFLVLLWSSVQLYTDPKTDR